MGVFEFERVESYLDDRYKTVVETGTCLGYSTIALAKAFRIVHTIELNEELYRTACRNFASFPHVQCHHGDSKIVLKQLIPKLHGQVIFFLDAHWSGDRSVDWGNSLWKGYGVETSYCGERPTPENQVPLLEEIRLIHNEYLEECIIYIDDADKFGADGAGLVNKGFLGENWSHLTLERLKEVIKDRVIKFDLAENQLVIKLREVTTQPKEVKYRSEEPDRSQWAPKVEKPDILKGPRGFSSYNS